MRTNKEIIEKMEEQIETNWFSYYRYKVKAELENDVNRKERWQNRMEVTGIQADTTVREFTILLVSLGINYKFDSYEIQVKMFEAVQRLYKEELEAIA